MWAYFALRAGWLKINVGTNLGRQIYMYLSALELLYEQKTIIVLSSANCFENFLLYQI